MSGASFDYFDNGTYNGNGGSQSISIGWTPSFVLISTERKSGGSSKRGFSAKFGTMATDEFQGLGNDATAENGITLTSDGFDVSSQNYINANGQVHHWIAVRSGVRTYQGQYTATGASNSQVVHSGSHIYNFFWSNKDAATPRFGMAPFTYADGYSTSFDRTIVSADNQVFRKPDLIPSRVNGLTEDNLVVVSGNANINTDLFDFVAFSNWGTLTRNTDASGNLINAAYLGDSICDADFFESTGNGDTQEIHLNFQPRAILCINSNIWLKTNSMPADEVAVLTDSGYSYSVGATITASGFIVDDINTNVGQYAHFLAWK